LSGIGVMHMVDTLDAGGLERVAVNLVNLLPRDRYRPHLCTTRRDGVLSPQVQDDVGRICLQRSSRFDVAAITRLSAYIRKHRIAILHAHGTALLVAVLASLLPPYPKVVWHDHYGALTTMRRPVLPYWLLTRRVAAVVCVNDALREWAVRKLKIAEGHCHYLPNFVCAIGSVDNIELPGVHGGRIVCVANLRRQKDHLTLLRALDIVRKKHPHVALLLVGSGGDGAYGQEVNDLIATLGLSEYVHLLGCRDDVASILRHCDVGVLSSASEGLPLALLEYGVAGLPVVVTDVGQCREVVDNGRLGMLVPPEAPESLAERVMRLLDDATLRCDLGRAFKAHIHADYGQEAVLMKLDAIYAAVSGDGTTEVRH